MRNYYSSILSLMAILLIVLVVPDSVHSQSPTPPSERIRTQQRIKDQEILREQKRTELKEQVRLQVATRQAQLTERRRIRINAFYMQMSKRINATIERLDVLISRIESRLEIIEVENANIDTSSIRADLELAKLKLDELKILNRSALESVPLVLESDDPKTSFEVIRKSIADIKDGLKEVHLILTGVIGDIKGLRAGNN